MYHRCPSSNASESAPKRYARRVGERGRLRTIVMIAIFDVGGPLITYVLLRDYAGLSAVLALVLSGTLPAFGVAITAIQYRRPDVFGAMVLIGILIGSGLGLVTHNPRLYLAEGSVPSLAFSIACLVSLRMRQPLIYRIALVCSKAAPYTFATVLAVWTLAYGERRKRMATINGPTKSESLI